MLKGTTLKVLTSERTNSTSRMETERMSFQRSILVDILIILFGISSWVAVNGLWVELPLLVNALPEAWKLPSYIVITTQMANLGPIAFSAARRIWSQKVLEIPTIHASLAILILACVMLSVFWDATAYVGGQMHSIAFLILTFFLAFVDCTSSLLFLPFIANFKEQYLLSYYIGTGLSGPVPGMLALAQGVGGYAECRNVSTTRETDLGNVTEYRMEAYYPPPRFSANIFFAILSGQMLISWIAFILLNSLPRTKKERVSLMSITSTSNTALEEDFQSSLEKDPSSKTEKTPLSQQNLLPSITSIEYFILLAIQGFVCSMHNGVLLSIQSYSCLPYGSLAYHLAVTLSSIANPFFCFIAMFLPVPKVNVVAVLTTWGAFWSAYILATALLSPHPPLVGTTLGSSLVVLSWIMVSGTIAFVKACIGNILRRKGGQTALYKCGVVTQIGSAIGAIVAFSLVQFTTLFHSYSPCS